MADTLMLNYEAISQEAANLQTEGDNMNDCITKITNIVNGLPDIWQADTGTRYVEQYNELHPSLEEAVQLIDDMVTQMNQIAANFQDTDAGMAGQM
ncbi:MAG: WXG100 family type VII secretion target [Lachnospiraceae bacterium]|nr:WXG100 family type VII secretion target [Lachnospiraceae bacterium]